MGANRPHGRSFRSRFLPDRVPGSGVRRDRGLKRALRAECVAREPNHADGAFRKSSAGVVGSGFAAARRPARLLLISPRLLRTMPARTINGLREGSMNIFHRHRDPGWGSSRPRAGIQDHGFAISQGRSPWVPAFAGTTVRAFVVAAVVLVATGVLVAPAGAQADKFQPLSVIVFPGGFNWPI